MNFSKFRTPLEIAGLSGGVGASTLAIQYSQEINKVKEENKELINDNKELKQGNIELGSINQLLGDNFKNTITKINKSIDSLKTVTDIFRPAASEHDLIKAADKHINEIAEITKVLVVS